MRHPAVPWIAIVALVLALCPAWAGAADDSKLDLGLIIVKDKVLAQRLQKEIAGGADFSGLAKQHSVGPAASRGGRLGLVPWSRLRVEYRKALEGLAPHTPTPVVPTEDGYAILMRFGAVDAAAQRTPAQAGPEESTFLLARQQVMAGIESLVAGDFPAAKERFSAALGYNPRQDSAPFFAQVADDAMAGKLKPQAVREFAQGFSAMLNGEPTRAQELFTKAAQDEPKLWQAILFQAILEAGAGHLDRARSKLEKVLIINPNSARANLTLANLARDTGNPEKAAAYYARAQELAPEMADIHYQKSALQMAQRDWQGAEASLRRAIAADPFMEEAYNDLALIMANTGRENEAIKAYHQALELNPQYFPAHMNLGNLYARQKRFNQAVDEYLKALQIEPRLGRAHAGLAAVYVIQENWPQAVKHAEEAERLGARLPGDLVKKVEAYRKRTQP